MRTKKTSYAWAMWLIAAAFYALDYFQHTAPSVLIEPISISLNTSMTTIGNVMGIYFPIYAIAQIPAGYLLDRFGIRLVLTLACLIVSLGLFIGATPTLASLVTSRALVAIGSAFAFLGALKTASAWLPKSAFPLAVGLTNTIGVLGGLLGQPFLNHLITQYHWQHAIFLISFFGFLLAAFIYVFLRSPPVTHGIIRKKPNLLPLLKDKQIWLLAIYAGIMVGTVVNAFSELYDVVFLEHSLNIGVQQAAIISSMVFVGIAVGGPCHGIIASLIKSKKHWMLIANGCTIVLFTAIVFSTEITLAPIWMYVLYFFTGFFVSSMLLAFAVARQTTHQSRHAMAFALLNMVISLCGFIFQELLGLALSYFSHHLDPSQTKKIFFDSFWVLLVPLIASFILCSALKRDS